MASIKTSIIISLYFFCGKVRAVCSFNIPAVGYFAVAVGGKLKTLSRARVFRFQLVNSEGYNISNPALYNVLTGLLSQNNSKSSSPAFS
jgi:hypothetical protein